MGAHPVVPVVCGVPPMTRLKKNATEYSHGDPPSLGQSTGGSAQCWETIYLIAIILQYNCIYCNYCLFKINIYLLDIAAWKQYIAIYCFPALDQLPDQGRPT